MSDKQWTGMSEPYREQHPLLYEDLSEEEQLTPQFQKRFRPMVYRGRSRNSAKGAASIIKLWPDHWSSILAYWWIGLGMIAVFTFILYNSVAAFAVLPSGTSKDTRIKTDLNSLSIEETQTTPEVFMHLFVEHIQEIDINNYLPYINIIADKYPNFKYHLIIVTNDTSIDKRVLSAEENNELALNLLWTKNDVRYTRNSNVYIEHVIFSKYIKNSPLRKHWNKLPKKFVEFLTRAVSIWDKGGIAFNPTILTPRSPHATYIEKIQNILKNFRHSPKKSPNDTKSKKKMRSRTHKKKVNNIRDIIDALLQNDYEDIHNISELNLEEAEAKYDLQTVSSGLKSVNDTVLRIKETNYEPVNHQIITNPNNQPDLKNFTKSSNSNDTSGILPMFLDFLFRNKPECNNSITEDNKTRSRRRKHVISTSNIDQSKGLTENLPSELVDNRIIKPIIISTKPVNNMDSGSTIEINRGQVNESNQLTIDLKGNIIASEISCHAFLGTIFSNGIHHTQDSLTDFIITELSIFCKGVLSSCKGIDVILL